MLDKFALYLLAHNVPRSVVVILVSVLYPFAFLLNGSSFIAPGFAKLTQFCKDVVLLVIPVLSIIFLFASTLASMLGLTINALVGYTLPQFRVNELLMQAGISAFILLVIYGYEYKGRSVPLRKGKDDDV